MNKIIKALNLEDDFLFAKVMCDPEICRRVLEKILDVKIKYVEIPVSQKIIDLDLNSKGIRLDIYVNDDVGTVYNVEMQKTNKYNLPKRSRYYQGNIDLDWIAKGKDYNELRESFVIFICGFDPFNKGKHYYTFKNICVEDNTLFLGDATTKIFLNTKGTEADVDEELLEFLSYMSNSTDEFVNHTKSELVKIVHEKVVELKEDKTLEVQYMTLLEKYKEMREEGIEQGIEQGLQQGLQIVKDSILDLLSDIGEVPMEVKDKIQQERDVAKLKLWNKKAARAESVENFVESIKE